jgi:hypothetical protein
VLRWIRGHYAEAWKQYGYTDAFNPLTGWYDADVIGIDLGISLLMAENQRTQFVWNTFMKDPAAQNRMNLAGFQPGCALEMSYVEILGVVCKYGSCPRA